MAIGVVLVAMPAYAEQQSTTAAPDHQYMDFPARIDPHGTHKHVPFAHGSRLYARPQIVAHDVTVDAQGHIRDDSYALDAESVVTRLPGETLIVEPDGRIWHLKPTVFIDRTADAWRYIVVQPGYPVPNYLTTKRADIVAP